MRLVYLISLNLPHVRPVYKRLSSVQKCFIVESRDPHIYRQDRFVNCSVMLPTLTLVNHVCTTLSALVTRPFESGTVGDLNEKLTDCRDDIRTRVIKSRSSGK